MDNGFISDARQAIRRSTAVHDLVVEAGRLMIESKTWPAKEVPKALTGKLKMSKTKTGSFRMAELTVPDGRKFLLIECNPAKVQVDTQGNGPKDKVMVKQIGKEEWVGQVRRLPFWHFHSFVPLANKTDGAAAGGAKQEVKHEKAAAGAKPQNAQAAKAPDKTHVSAKAAPANTKKMTKQAAAPARVGTLKPAARRRLSREVDLDESSQG